MDYKMGQGGHQTRQQWYDARPVRPRRREALLHSGLRKKLIKLAHDKPQHREDILPFLKTADEASGNHLDVWADMDVLDAIWRGFSKGFGSFEEGVQKQLESMDERDKADSEE